MRTAKCELSLTDVSKSFDRQFAVRNLSLQVADGEMLAIVGHSGSGKTTLLRLIAGLETPDSGTIEISGERVNEKASFNRKVGMVFQDLRLYPHLNVRENLEFALSAETINSTARAERLGQVSEALSLSELFERSPASLSGGQQQRVALGRAIVRRPRVLLLDEPFAHLDSPLRSRLRDEIRRLHRDWNMTTLYVTHDQADAFRMGDRIAVMRHGCLEQVGNSANLLCTPTNQYVAEFFSEWPINYLPAALVGDSQGCIAFRADAMYILADSSLAKEHTFKLTLRIESIHPQGRDIEVRGRWQDQNISAVLRSTGCDLSVGTLLELAVDAENLMRL